MKKFIRFFFPAMVGVLMSQPLPASQGQGPVKVLVHRLEAIEKAEVAPMQGILYFDKVSHVSGEVEGLARTIHFSSGSMVKAGTVLVRLNTDFIDHDIRLTQAQIQRLDVRIEHTQKDLQRYTKLLKEEAASETDFENLSYSHRELLKEREALEVNLSKIRLKKAKSIIRAPFDGIILEKKVDRGDWVQPGKALCRIGSTKDLFVNLPIHETLLKKIPQGISVRVDLHALGREVTGRMEGLLPLADEMTKNVSLKIRLPEQSHAVENMSTTVYLPTSPGKELKKIPRDALRRRGDTNFVFTVADHKAQSIPLEILFFEGAFAYSDSPGLTPGMTLILDGNQRLGENQPVKILGEHL